MDVLAKLMAQAAGSAGDDHGDQPVALTAPDAERIVEQLRNFKVADVGSPQWHAQRDSIAMLNLQAHTNANTNSDEFVVELLVSLDRMKTLVHDLLTIEAWKQHVLPQLREQLGQQVNTSLIYLVLYHECSLANLLELTLYHSHAVESLPEEHLMELADWCSRKLSYLASPAGHLQASIAQHSAQDMMNQTRAQEMMDKEAETEFGSAMCAVTIIRYLSDGVTSLPLGLINRLTSINDTPMALVALLEDPPWVRRRGKGRLEKWINNSWSSVEPRDRLKLTIQDAQVWLTLNNLLVEPRCRTKYDPDEWRRDKLQTLKRHMNELLFDQLPVLKDLRQVLDAMALSGTASDATRPSPLILEAVPGLREALLHCDGRVVAKSQAATWFSEQESHKQMKAQMGALAKQLDLMAGLEESEAASRAEQGAGQTELMPLLVHLSCWRKVHETGVHETWSDYELAVDEARRPEPIVLESIRALRYRLTPLNPATVRALPTMGKVSVKLSGGPLGCNADGPGSTSEPMRAEALLQLPEVPVRSMSADQPAVVWVNIGLLAEEGLVLQLKLERMQKPQERDRLAGGWYAYVPVGGALTVRQPAEATGNSTNHASAGGGIQEVNVKSSKTVQLQETSGTGIQEVCVKRVNAQSHGAPGTDHPEVSVKSVESVQSEESSLDLPD